MAKGSSGAEIIEAAADLLPGGAVALGAARAMVQRRQEQRANDALRCFLYEVIASGEATAEATAKALEDGTPEQIDALLGTINEMLRAIDPRAKVYLARMGAPYFARGAARDRFFCRAGNMLTAADGLEIAHMEEIFRHLHKLCSKGLPIGMAGAPALRIRRDYAGGALIRFEGKEESEAEWETDIFEGVQLLKRSGLFAECSATVPREDVPHWVIVRPDEGETLGRLLQIFRSR